jgi:hypothetical protein
LGELSTRHDSHAHAPLDERPLQGGHARGDLLDANTVIGADMGRCAHHLDPVLLGLAGHCQAVVEAAGAIVEFGEDVAMEIDHSFP